MINSLFAVFGWFSLLIQICCKTKLFCVQWTNLWSKRMVTSIKKGKNITEKRHNRMAADLMRATSSAFVPGRFLTEAATSKTGRTKTCYYLLSLWPWPWRRDTRTLHHIHLNSDLGRWTCCQMRKTFDHRQEPIDDVDADQWSMITFAVNVKHCISSGGSIVWENENVHEGNPDIFSQ